MVPSSELLSRIQSRYPSVTKAPDDFNDTARNYIIPGHRGNIGFISSMSDHFCGSCNRLRLTADGQIKVRPLCAVPRRAAASLIGRTSGFPGVFI